ncbi:uncharacterized protein LOC121007421 isoform X1 [Bufo bufo]|uniref:uncharacterized protein LOC121007421 isoform X1 n=1 Tax=Bufo bufo TaxID=8384 RepID=UPI001ABEAE7B|nr:uncharacterized protein LOC121007421 isoform X1 [Bufo bufo]
MDIVRKLLFLLLLSRSVSSLQLTGPSVHAARLGSDALVPCSFTVDKPPVDPNLLTIYWRFFDKEILSYNKTVMTTSSRYSLSTEALMAGNANLTISNIQIHDGGMYKCSVMYGSEKKEKELRLDSGAPPQVTITGKTVVLNEKSFLRCSAAGFHPPDIEMKWFKGGEKLEDNVFTGESWKNPARTYNMNSTVTIIPSEEDREGNFSCRVQHKFLQEPLQEDFRLLYEDTSSAGIIAACSVIGIILIVLIAGVLYWKLKLRRKDNGVFIVRDFKGPSKLIDGEEATLYYTVDNCPENLCVTWMMRRAGQVQEIQTSQMREHSEEEEESLLDASYVIRSQREGHQYLSSLSFIPHMERHKDVTFICRGVYKKHNDEKKFHCKTIHVKAKLSQPIMRSLMDSGEMKYLLNLEKFYPKTIKIIWICGVGEPEEVLSSTESVSDNPDRTYSVSSEVRIPEERHKDPGFRVRVTWDHESLGEAESKELSIRDSDYRWTPVVEEIQIPRLLHGTPATLQCNISGYFPDAVTVRWRRRAGDEMYEETENQRITSRRAADNTCNCTSSLTITPTLETHQGAEYICLVEHPTLETPIEKTTGRLQVLVKPQLSQAVIRRLMDTGEIKYVLNLEKFRPKKIRIVWTCGVGRPEKVLQFTESVSDNPDRTYSVSSEVRIPEERHKDPGFRVRVTWDHDSMEEAESRELSIRDSDYRWTPVVEEIQIPRLLHDTPATLQCNISEYFPDAVTVRWRRRAGDEIYEETENQRITSGRAADNTYNCTSSLTITPTLETHQGAEYICLVEHPTLEKPIMKTTGRLQVTVKPQLSQAVIRRLMYTGEIKYVLNLEKFRPKNIRIVWTCGVGRPEEVLSSTESVSENPDRTYRVSSEVRIPEERHKDPGFRVRVTWGHDSMEEAESRELSIRDTDYIWTPVVEEIQIPRLRHDTPATLQCNILGYFPDAVTVRWMRRAGDEMYEETENQRITSGRMTNNTYICTSNLTITPTLGAEYICLVEHPTLEKPIEKTTGRLQVTEKYTRTTNPRSSPGITGKRKSYNR